MSACLLVLAPGLLTTVQDFGRPGLQHLGLPVSGALDPVSLSAANLLVGNRPNTAALEVAYVGPTLRVDAQEVHIAVVPATADMLIYSDDSSTAIGRRIVGNRSVRLRRGECLRIGSLRGSAIVYLAVQGGFDFTPIAGSVSTCLRSGFGGTNGRPLIAGDRLPLSTAVANSRDECCLVGLDLRPPQRFRAIPGPQSDLFSPSELAAFFSAQYTIAPGSNRMGMRLSGHKVIHQHGYEIVSDAIPPGAIQVLGDGQPILLLADRQTTGGYPKIATVISADLPALGRMGIGMNVRFAHNVVRFR